MPKPATIVATVILSVSAVFMFKVKHKVQDLKRDLVEYNRQLASDREAIYVLKAEWAYLTDPVRIKKLSDNYLTMQHANAIQAKFNEELPYRFLKDNDPINIVVVPKFKPILSSYKGEIESERKKPTQSHKSWWQF